MIFSLWTTAFQTCFINLARLRLLKSRDRRGGVFERRTHFFCHYPSQRVHSRCINDYFVALTSQRRYSASVSIRERYSEARDFRVSNGLVCTPCTRVLWSMLGATCIYLAISVGCYTLLLHLVTLLPYNVLVPPVSVLPSFEGSEHLYACLQVWYLNIGRALLVFNTAMRRITTFRSHIRRWSHNII